MKNISNRKWVFSVLLIQITVLLLISFVAYTVDPFMYYRVDDSKKVLNARFVNIGLIKNYDYDTAIIGSSMIQNFNMTSFREKLGWNPLKITGGALSVSETLQMYNLVKEYSDIEKYIINIDLQTFNNQISFETESINFPEYLYNKSKYDDFKYLLGYETWFRFIPINFVIDTVYRSGLDLPAKYYDSTQIDMISDWSKDYLFDEDIVRNNFVNNSYSVSKVNKENMIKRMEDNIDIFFEVIMDDYNNEEIILMFPPYSALYWSNAMNEGYFNQLIAAKEYFIVKFNIYPNFRIIDMQDIDLITDLNHYRDSTHYDTIIQEMIVDAIVTGEYDLDNTNFQEKRQKLEYMVNYFSIMNDDWISKKE